MRLALFSAVLLAIASGPVAALAAGLRVTKAPLTVLLAADLPFADAELVHKLWISLPGYDGAVLTDRAGKDQWLAACYRRSALTEAIERHTAERGDVVGLSLKRLLAGFDLARVPDVADQAFDCDTWEDVEAARRIADSETRSTTDRPDAG